MRAGIYVRISRDVTGKSLGVQRQEEDCRALAERLGWEVAETYIDNDISATSGKPRPAYRQLLDDLRSGTIGAIVAWHPDRLYRRAIDLGELVDVCKTTDAKVATVNAGEVDLTSPTGLLVADMLAAIAMYEVRHKSERWTRSWRQGRERGEVVKAGRRMFGYTRDGHIVPEEAAHARTAVADILSGVPITALIRRWRDEGIRTTGGTEWTPIGLKQYLTNPRLAGWSTLKGEIVAEGNWEPIIDKETWETVRALLAARSRAKAPRVAVLNGLVFCGPCDSRLITAQQRGLRIYRCPPASRPGYQGCGRVSINAESLEQMVEGYAQRRLDDPRIRERLAKLTHGDTGRYAAEALALERRLKELEAQLDEPGVPVATIMRAMDRTRERLEQIDAQMAASTAPRQLPARGAPWPADLERRHRLISLAVERVVVNPTTRRGPGFDPARVRIDPL